MCPRDKYVCVHVPKSFRIYYDEQITRYWENIKVEFRHKIEHKTLLVGQTTHL